MWNFRKIRWYFFEQESHIAPLAVFRMAFGAIMFFSTIRFMLKGWVTGFYVKPVFHFTFYGFEWIKPFGATGMYIVFLVMAVSALGIMLGLFYRTSVLLFLVSFVYVELLDKTYYLNHYYLVSLISFLLLFVPAHRYCSLDVKRNPALVSSLVPVWTITIFKLQLIIVYVFAGLSKLTYPWLIDAMPLRIWLPANEDLPLIGGLLKQSWIAYLFSWFGAVYDLCICFFLLNGRTRNVAFITVIVFHLLTAVLFKIGMFPFIMIAVTTIFFSEQWHQRLIDKLNAFFREKDLSSDGSPQMPSISRIVKNLLIAYFVFQILIPLRFVLYPGNLLWTEEGYRFSWRVMLMEKSGQAFFYVSDLGSDKRIEVPASMFLSSLQEKMMCTQPDMMLQFAHFLDETYAKKGMKDPVVTTDCYVTLNGKGTRPFIDNRIDLSRETESFRHKNWVLPIE